jgi:hypothetical protein
VTLSACERALRWLESHPWRVLALLLSIGLAVDSGWLWTHPPGMESGETSHWWPVVINVARGHGFSGCFPDYFPFCGPGNQVTAAREPVPVLLFAGVARLSGESLQSAVALEILLDLGILIGIFLLARGLAGALAATLAALLWSVYLPSLEMILQVSGDLTAALGVIWGLFFITRARRSDDAREWFIAGCCVGLAGLSRSAVMALAPAIIPIASPWGHASPRRRWRGVVIFASTFAVTLIPWVVRNEAVLGRPILGSTLTGYNLYRHSSLLPSGDYLRVVAGADSERAIRDLVARRRDLRGTENEAEMNRIYTREALTIIGRWPLRYALLSAYRFLPLWFNWGVREAYGVHPRLPDYLLMAEQGLLLLAAMVGSRRLGRQARPLVVSVAAFSLVHMLVNAQLRYLAPVMPLTMALGGAALAPLLEGALAPRAR